jgi:hypothetical protein
MIELFIGIVVIVCTIAVFYNQSVNEFRINQISWDKRNTFQNLTAEKIPIVISDITQPTFWTKTDVSQRACYESIPIFDGIGLYQWLIENDSSVVCAWSKEHAMMIGDKSGLPIWAEKWFSPFIHSNFFKKMWLHPTYSCWAGNVGLFSTSAEWTAIFVTEGQMNVSIMPKHLESALPKPYKGTFLPNLTIADTPFINDLQFIDVVLRPGTCLFMPTHWFVCWSSTDDDIPMVCMVEYHSPISYGLSLIKNNE